MSLGHTYMYSGLMPGSMLGYHSWQYIELNEVSANRLASVEDKWLLHCTIAPAPVQILWKNLLQSLYQPRRWHLPHPPPPKKTRGSEMCPHDSRGLFPQCQKPRNKPNILPFWEPRDRNWSSTIGCICKDHSYLLGSSGYVLKGWRGRNQTALIKVKLNFQSALFLTGLMWFAPSLNCLPTAKFQSSLEKSNIIQKLKLSPQKFSCTISRIQLKKKTPGLLGGKMTWFSNQETKTDPEGIQIFELANKDFSVIFIFFHNLMF